MKQAFAPVARWLQGLSFRTGVIVLCVAVVCYIISFAQMMLPISVTAKGVIWFIFFGLAKTAQYSGLLIVGVEGWRRIKSRFRLRTPQRATTPKRTPNNSYSIRLCPLSSKFLLGEVRLFDENVNRGREGEGRGDDGARRGLRR